MTEQVGQPDIDKMVSACRDRLAPSADWKPFTGYPDSLDLSVVDAIWSINARYVIAKGVVERYRERRRWQGNPEEDGLPELLAFYKAVGGVDGFIDEVGTRNRVSTQPDAVRKGDAVHRANYRRSGGRGSDRAVPMPVTEALDNARQFLFDVLVHLVQFAGQRWIVGEKYFAQAHRA